MIFAGYTGSENQVWNRQTIKLKNQVRKSISRNREQSCNFKKFIKIYMYLEQSLKGTN